LVVSVEASPVACPNDGNAAPKLKQQKAAVQAKNLQRFREINIFHLDQTSSIHLT